MYTLETFLPTDRWLPGFMRLYRAGPEAGRLFYDIPCRGKADSKRAAKNGNPKRHPFAPWGDIPSGIYRPASPTLFKPKHRTFGHAAILLEGETGDALKARQNGRTGLAIHANRGNDRLMATYGCIRVFDRDMDLFVNTILGDTVRVAVINCPEWPPA